MSLNPESQGHYPVVKVDLFLVESHDVQFELPAALQVKHEISQVYVGNETHKATPLSEYVASHGQVFDKA